MPKGRPSWSVVLVKLDDLDVLINGLLVLTSGCAVLSKLVHFLHLTQAATFSWGNAIYPFKVIEATSIFGK